MQNQNGWDGNSSREAGYDSFAPADAGAYFESEPPVRHFRTYEEPESPRPPKQTEKPGKVYLYAAITAVCLIGAVFLAVMLMPQVAGYFWKDFGNYAFVNGEVLRYDESTVGAYKQYRAYLDQDVIYPGVFVDGVHVGGLTVSQAEELLSGQGAAPSEEYSVTVNVGDRSWKVDSSRVPLTRGLGNVLQRAYAIGRTNTTEIQTDARTPFRERADRAAALRGSGVNLTTDSTYDPEDVRAVVKEILAYVTREPVNAQIQSFDYKTRTFTFTESSPGVTLDGEALFSSLCAALDRREKGLVITVPPQVKEPDVSTETLRQSFKLVAAYTTKTTGSDARNRNISLAAQAVNGTAVMPGETFSFNAATGERTVAKGYQAAPAITGGQTVDEIGGGVCQASSTLFNAVARANLEIVSRSPHAWPSSYVNPGEDATVDWPNLDFKFRNNTQSPVFVIMYYKNREVSAEIWGITLGEGVKIELESRTVKTMKAPADPKYVYNPGLPYGSSKTTVKARSGSVVETYQVWYRDGKETGRKLLHTSTYKAYQETVEYNWGDGSY